MLVTFQHQLHAFEDYILISLKPTELQRVNVVERELLGKAAHRGVLKCSVSCYPADRKQRSDTEYHMWQPQLNKVDLI